jgi:hypothetical protein
MTPLIVYYPKNSVDCYISLALSYSHVFIHSQIWRSICVHSTVKKGAQTDRQEDSAESLSVYLLLTASYRFFMFRRKKKNPQRVIRLTDVQTT